MALGRSRFLLIEEGVESGPGSGCGGFVLDKVVVPVILARCGYREDRLSLIRSWQNCSYLLHCKSISTAVMTTTAHTHSQSRTTQQ